MSLSKDHRGQKERVNPSTRIRALKKGYKIRYPKWKHITPGSPGNSYSYNICGAKRQNRDKICHNIAGFKTWHPGVGRCIWHGGASKPRLDEVTTGRGALAMQHVIRQAYIERTKIEELDGDPLDLRAELAVQRDLLYMFMARQAKAHNLEMPPVPVTEAGESILNEMPDMDTVPIVDFIETIYKMIGDITRVTNAISAQRKEAVLSMAEVKFLRLVLEETFVKFIPDQGQREQALQFFASRSDRQALTRQSKG